MIKRLKKIVDWLDSKFPTQLVVLKEDFDAAANAVKKIESECQDLKTRLIAAETKLVSLDKLATDTKNEVDQANVVAANLLKPRTLPDVYGTR